MKNLARKLALALGSSAAALLVLEAGVRVFELAPRFTAVPFGSVVTSADSELLWEPRAGFGPVNEDGFRGAPLERPKRRPRIVLTGDSIAYGIGLEDHETIPVRLAEHLRAGGFDAEVLNLGVAGYNSVQEARRLEVLLPELEADRVVLLFCLNDFQALDQLPEGVVRSAKKEGAGRALGLVYRSSTDSELERVLTGSSHLFRLLRSATSRETPRIRGAAARAQASDDTRVVREGFDRIAALSKSLGVPVTVAIMPSLSRKAEYHRSDEHEVVAELAGDRGFPVLDLTVPVREVLIGQGHELALPGDRLHPNAEGADVVARVLADWLRTEGFLD